MTSESVLYGVDAHGVYQRGLDVEQLAREDFSFLVVKATQGTDYIAPSYADWVLRAEHAGMVAGLYHWLDQYDGAGQARHFLRRFDDVGGVNGRLVQLDVEGLGGEREARDWLAEFWRHAPGHPVLVYSGHWWWSVKAPTFDVAALGPVYQWQSRYVSGTGYASALYQGVPEALWTGGEGAWGGFDEATILQFSSKGSAGGLTGIVDVNAFRGTREQLVALTRAASDQINPERGIPMGKATLVRATGSPDIFLGDGMTRRHIPDEASLHDVIWVGRPEEEGGLGFLVDQDVHEVADLDAFGALLAAPPQSPDAAPVAPPGWLTPESLGALVAASVRKVLREGVADEVPA